jgi:DNA-directed RNA polymerase subunit RPC12/RpoP
MEKDAERVADKAFESFAKAWRQHAKGYPGGTMAFLAAHLDKAVDDAARTLGISGGAVLWARDRFATKAKVFMNESATQMAPSESGTVGYKCVHCGYTDAFTPQSELGRLWRCSQCHQSFEFFQETMCSDCGAEVTALLFEISPPLLAMTGIKSQYRTKNEQYSNVLVCNRCGKTVECSAHAPHRDLLSLSTGRRPRLP